jgi:hypothetical protein
VREVAFGYRYDEVESLMKLADPHMLTVKIHGIRNVLRVPVAVSLGPRLIGSLLPHADPADSHTLAAGVISRMGKNITIDSAFLKGLRKYTKRWIKKRGIARLSWDADTDFDTWLSKTNYPYWRKLELIEYKDSIDDMLKRNAHGELCYFMIKLFMKDEHYVDFKHARGIYARDDAAKITFGPWFKMIEHELYSQPEFIKHIPVRDRGRYIYDRLYRNGAKYIATDYSSFEAHFTAEVMENCEFILYDHMLGSVNGGEKVLELMREVLKGENKIVNKFVSARCNARRMSGEMNTSLGNGFSNLMFMGYLCELQGYGEILGCVEGDDGLFTFVGDRPTSDDFSKYGFLIKLDAYEQISEASFCGNLFDEEAFQIITDPYDVVSSIGWATARYSNAKRSKHDMLLRCKALSMAHQYPGCPIIGALSQYCLRMTRKCKDLSHFTENRRDISLWEREQLREASDFVGTNRDESLYVEPAMATRLMFDKLYHIDVKSQIIIENQLNELNELKPLDIPLLSDFVHKSWKTYSDNYIVSYPDKVPAYDFITTKVI